MMAFRTVRRPGDIFGGSEMGELWTTVASRLLAAIEPSTLLDVGDDGGRFAALAGAAVAAWGGKVISIRPEAGPAGPTNLDVRTPYAPAPVISAGHLDLAVLHGEPNWWTTAWQLTAVAQAADEAQSRLPLIVVAHTGAPWGRRDCYVNPDAIPAERRQPNQRDGDRWVALDEGTAHNGVLTAVEEFAQARPGLEVIHMAGLGGVAVVLDLGSHPTHSEPVRAILSEWRWPPQTVALVETVDAELRERSRELDVLRRRVGDLATQLTAERARSEQSQARLSVLEELRYGLPRAHPAACGGVGSGGLSGGNGTPADEPTRELVRQILHPAELVRALGWPGKEAEIALPIPVDRRGLVDPGADRSLVVITNDDPGPLRTTLCSVLERAMEPLALTMALPTRSSSPLEEFLTALEVAIPAIELADAPDIQPRPGAQRLDAGEELPWGWPHFHATTEAPKVAYLLPGLPPEGSGGVHSVVQEARGLRQLGADSRVCLPSGALERAERLYDNRDSLFVAYQSEAEIHQAVGDATVAVATEHTSVRLLSRLARERPGLVCAYYVQDYEPLFAELGSPRSDRALLSYRAHRGAALFAKTHFIRNVVAALHDVPVAKVAPSLDRSVFNADARPAKVEQRLTVTAMLRPRTPRRRPLATLAALSLIETELGDNVETVTFGCDQSELDTALRRDHLRHLGRLRSEEVAEQFRRTDIFIDGSAYQAFGRSGLEAMACGAVPVLPSLGGVGEYAVDDENAIVLNDDSPNSLANAVICLAGDRDRLTRLANAGLRTARGFSVERAAQSQLALFSFLKVCGSGSIGPLWPFEASG
jgi:hypothetical protein